MLEAGVPWRVETVEERRLEFCRLAESEAVTFVELCRRFGISPKTGYKWLSRFRVEGVAGLVDRSRRPLRSPARTSMRVEELVCDLRRDHPAWGGRKISRRLRDLGYGLVPAPSTVTDILRRNGLLSRVEAHRSGFVSFEASAPNELWQMDFKGWFETGTGRCHPFDVLDDHSRFNLCLHAGHAENYLTVKTQLTGVFERYGLPARILCDNGHPWGSTNSQYRYTRLGVWLIDLGIIVVHSRPRHPQTVGKDERFHRTLDLEVISTETQWESHQQVQVAFDQWRPVYNHQRPHDSLDLATPADRYQPSPRSIPTRIEPVDYPPGYQVRKVEAGGRITYQGNRYKIGKPFIGRHVGILPTTTNTTINVVYRHHHIRTINLTQ